MAHNAIKFWQVAVSSDNIKVPDDVIRTVVIRMGERPFPSMRVDAYVFLKTVLESSRHGLASLQPFLYGSSSLKTALQDGTSENDYDSRLAKWEFVKTLTLTMGSDAMVAAFGSDTADML